MSSRVTSDMSRCYDMIGTDACDRAVASCMSKIARDVERYVPKRSGDLAKSMRVDGTRISWRTPYASKQYFHGKSAHWVREARKDNGRAWVRTIARALAD